MSNTPPVLYMLEARGCGESASHLSLAPVIGQLVCDLYREVKSLDPVREGLGFVVTIMNQGVGSLLVSVQEASRIETAQAPARPPVQVPLDLHYEAQILATTSLIDALKEAKEAIANGMFDRANSALETAQRCANLDASMRSNILKDALP